MGGLGEVLGQSWRGLGVILGGPGTIVGRSWSHWGWTKENLAKSMIFNGFSMCLGWYRGDWMGSWGGLGGVLRRSWGVVEQLGGVSEGSWGALERSLGSWRGLGPILGGLGGALGGPGASWGGLGSLLGVSWRLGRGEEGGRGAPGSPRGAPAQPQGADLKPVLARNGKRVRLEHLASTCFND